MSLLKRASILSVILISFMGGCNSGKDSVTLPNNLAPAANFTFSCAGLNCSFADSSIDSDGTIVSWQWDFGDGNTASEKNPNHNYSRSGTFGVNLTVKDDDNASSSHAISVEVGSKNTTPLANFSFNCNGLLCFFLDASTDSDGSIVSWEWDFGDGNSSTQQNPSYSYSASGAYNVTLSVIDNDDARDNHSESLQVTNSMNISGSWFGGWRDPSSSGTFTLDLTQTGDTINGTYSGTDLEQRVYYGLISGTVFGNRFSGNFAQTTRGRFDCYLSFTFDAIVNSATMTADYSGAGSSCERARLSGQFTASRR